MANHLGAVDKKAAFSVIDMKFLLLSVLSCRFYTLHSLSKATTMAAWTAAARQAAHMPRISSPKSSLASTQASSLIHWRGLAGGSDHHVPPKVNFPEDPMSPSKWKEEHFVIVSSTGWGLLF